MIEQAAATEPPPKLRVAGSWGYPLISDSLRRLIEVDHLEADLRRVIREELLH